MSKSTRRDVVKLAAGLAAASAVPATGEELARPEAGDSALQRAMDNPQIHMLSEPVTFQLETDRFSRDLHITSARDQQGKSMRVRVPSHSVRIFRADAAVDDFTRQGGLHWRFNGKDGKTLLKHPGGIVMVVREGDTVRCYTMTPDFRC